mgnify:CR=1 FL=1
MAYVMKKKIANKNNYGGKRSLGQIKYIVIHYTGNDGDTDESNGNYFANNIVKASAHYFVSGDSITQSVPDDYVAWSVGGNRYSNYKQTGGAKFYKEATNTNTLNIELCDDVRNGSVYPSAATIANALAFTKEMMKKYNIPASRVIRHFDVTGKSCPAYWCGNSSKNQKWLTKFHNKLSGASSGGGNTTPPSTSDKLYRVRKTWNDASSQIGAYSSLENAKKACKSGYTVFDWNGNAVYPVAAPNNDLNVDGQWGKSTTKALQKILGTTQDGIVSYQPKSNKKYLEACYSTSWQFVDDYKPGSNMVRALQSLIGVTADGYFGKNSAIALQKYLEKNGFSVGSAGCNGYVGKDTVSALQRWINKQI